MPDLIPNFTPGIGFPEPAQSVAGVYLLHTPAPQDDTFEIGLVLGGTVSAGAYTAGVLDFLIEALDAWTAAKAVRDLNAPDHKVVIRIITGTSGGGVTAVLLARFLGVAFRPFNSAFNATQLAQNPLYDLWVNRLDIKDFLATTDLANNAPIVSLLCADQIDVTTAAIAQRPTAFTASPPRPYITQPLPVVLTLTNLRGIPYSTDFKGTSGRPEYFLNHADYLRFRVDISGNSPPKTGLLPDEIGISDLAGVDVQPWLTIAAAARATSAFPIGLPPQLISRDIEHYRYRPAILDTPTGPAPFWLRPAWPYMIPLGATNTTPYQFLSVDGGCIDNEPIELARTWLAGLLGHNDQQPTAAHRAILLVDPFADAPRLGPTQNAALLSTIFPFFNALVANNRFDTADLDLFTDENVYSRFLISAIRPGLDTKPWTGGDALAGSALSAFMGFMSRAYRHHDFMLGRYNCRAFLARHFLLHPENSLFNGWNSEQRKLYASGGGGFLPIIPLLGTAATAQPLPSWPKNEFSPDSIRPLVRSRVQGLLGVEETQALSKFIRWLAVHFANDKVADLATEKFIALLNDEIQKAHL